MALPTTNLTLHLDASDTDKLFTTWVDGGSHTGTPGDGDAVQAWSRETDGSVTPAHAAYSTDWPLYRSGTPLMALPCLDFDGTDSEVRIVDNTNRSSYLNGGQLVGAQAKTILVAFWAEAVSLSSADPSENHGLIAFGDCALTLKSVGGNPKIHFNNHDGGWDTVEESITTAATVVACARHDATNIYISVDGGSEVSTASGATGTWPSSDMRIGRAAGSGRLNARIGEIAIYSAALTGTDLTDAIAYFRAKWQGVGGPTARIVTPYAAVTF
jgi:hypothetical protein